ncbi:MAG: peptide deformylase, partial [Anaerolineae bacterium]
MATRDILQLGNPLLWEVSAPVEAPFAPEIKTLVEDLDDTLAAYRAAHGVGRGIAAPQIGVLQRVIFVRMPGGRMPGGRMPGGSAAFHGPLI